jgi:hypothetical protein
VNAKTTPPIDGGRQRCVGCGHPRREHRHDPDECTVPKCACREYQLADAETKSRTRARHPA